jgi:acetyltransferase-like isoleucine patch superfamily enzyme
MRLDPFEMARTLRRRAILFRSRRLPAGVGLEQWIADQAYRLPADSDVSLPDATGLAIFDLGNGNMLVAPPAARNECRLRFDATARDNLIVFGASRRFPVEIHCQGSRNLCVIGQDITWPNLLIVRFSSDEGRLLWGNRATSNGTSIILEGAGRAVTVGDDSMFATGTAVRTSDLHVIKDRSTGEALNPSADVRIGPHVWIGQDVLVGKGASIGEGAVIGAKALVTGNIPAHALAAGVPAKVRRENVLWERDRPPAT